jgi:hypothetical protein
LKIEMHDLYPTMRVNVLLFFFPIFLCGCSTHEEKNGVAAQVLLPTEKEDFRGHNIGDHITDVERREDPNTSVYSMPDELMYRVPLSGANTSWYEVSYQFSENGLYDILLEVYAANDTIRDVLSKDIAAHYQHKFGDFSGGGHHKEWRVMSAEGRFISIQIIDSLFLKDKPALRVKYKEEYDK